MELMTDFVTCT